MTGYLWGDAAPSGTGLARSTAVLADFIPVPKAVCAGWSLADPSPANAAPAVRGNLASLTGRAALTIRWPAAINARLAVVLHAIRARGRLAVSAGAYPGETVGGYIARTSGGTR